MREYPRAGLHKVVLEDDKGAVLVARVDSSTALVLSTANRGPVGAALAGLVRLAQALDKERLVTTLPV